MKAIRRLKERLKNLRILYCELKQHPDSSNLFYCCCVQDTELYETTMAIRRRQPSATVTFTSNNDIYQGYSFRKIHSKQGNNKSNFSFVYNGHFYRIFPIFLPFQVPLHSSSVPEHTGAEKVSENFGFAKKASSAETLNINIPYSASVDCNKRRQVHGIQYYLKKWL